MVEQLHTQLMEAGERELHFPFRTYRMQYPAPVGSLGGVLEEGRLADPGFAAQHEVGALPLMRFREQLIDRRTLGLTPREHGLTAGDHDVDPENVPGLELRILDLPAAARIGSRYQGRGLARADRGQHSGASTLIARV
jgi:hypothetical protein